MSTVQEIEAAIERLPRQELLKLTEWISARFGDEWDRQIEEDIEGGRLAHLAQEAIGEYKAGRARVFPSSEE